MLSSFSFGRSSASTEKKAQAAHSLALAKTNEVFSTQNQTYTLVPRGLTPPINGEHCTVKRSYSMRLSTVRKLNTLKAEHPDVNVLFNTIVDMAISYYYNYIFNENGSFSVQEEKNINS